MFHLFPKVYGHDDLLNNTKPAYLKGENEFKMQIPIFITQDKQSGLGQYFLKVDVFSNYDSY
jgi:hypothetical protein